MTETPVFTVILTAYNAEGTVKRITDEILHQSFDDYEVIAVDDGSTDQTGVILSSYEKEGKIRLISQENKGVSAARNAALDHTHGKYIFMVDADDEISGDCLAVFAGLMEKGQLGVAGYESRNEADGATVQYVLEEGTISKEEAAARILRYRDLSSACWNKCFERKIIEDNHIRFDEELAIGEDMLFVTEYCMHIDTAACSSQIVYTYVRNTDSVMNEGNRKNAFQTKWISEWKAVKKTEAVLSSNGIAIPETKIKEARIANKLLNLMHRYRYEDAELKKELMQAVKDNCSIAVKEDEFTLKQKISMVLKKMGIG